MKFCALSIRELPRIYLDGKKRTEYFAVYCLIRRFLSALRNFHRTEHRIIRKRDRYKSGVYVGQ